MSLILLTRCGDATQLTNPVVGPVGADEGSPTYSYAAAKFGNGAKNSVALTGKRFTSVRPNIGLFSIGFWIQWPATPTSAVSMWSGGLGVLVNPSLSISHNNAVGGIWMILIQLNSISKYIWLRPATAVYSTTAANQLQYFEMVVDSTGLNPLTVITWANIGTMIKIYTTDSSGVLAQRTIATSTYSALVGSPTFGDYQTAGPIGNDIGVVGNNVTGIANTNAPVDNIRIWSHARSISEMNDRHNERSGLFDQ